VRSGIIWWLSPKYVVGVAALVLDDEDRVLLLRHTYRGSRPWGLPGGGLKPGESLEECVEREVLEETGLKVEAEHLLSAAAHYDRRLVDMIFSCRVLPGYDLRTFAPNAEVAEARFFSRDELPQGMSWGQRRLVSVALAQAEERRQGTH
jgi:ADP-ribose pyrophosphatase YjhB (NUDIX family)